MEAQTPPPEAPKVTTDSDRRYMLLAFRILGDLGLSIALPVVLLAMLGRALDARYGTKPWLLIAGFALAAFISGYTVWIKAKRYGDEYQSIEKK